MLPGNVYRCQIPIREQGGSGRATHRAEVLIFWQKACGIVDRLSLGSLDPSIGPILEGLIGIVKTAEKFQGCTTFNG